MHFLNSQLRSLLLAAYAPCPGFERRCRDMRWAPEKGHVPRGFCGATGSLSEVQLVLVGAEPGDPHPSEAHASGGSASDQIESAFSYAYQCFEQGRDLYHRNIRLILSLCWPDQDFESHMRRVWITDSVLCSARVEGGPIPAAAAHECRVRYLESQLELFPKAMFAPLGGKAYSRLGKRSNVLKAFAAAPPGCNFTGARESWNRVASLVQSRAA